MVSELLTTSDHPVRGHSEFPRGDNAELHRRRNGKATSVSVVWAFPFDRECVANLVGQKLARIEREFILQTLRSHQGNRTHTADRLGISVRSLRDKIRTYRRYGESVPEPGNPALI